MSDKKIKPDVNANGFKAPVSDMENKRKAAHDTTGSENKQILAKLDYLMALYEGVSD